MSASANLFSLINAKNQKRYFEQQLLIASSKKAANAERLSDWENFEAKWETAYDNCYSMDKEYKVGSKIFIKKQGSGDNVTYKIGAAGVSGNLDKTAQKYATAKVRHDFGDGGEDVDKLEELTDKDMSFDTMQTTFQAMCDMLDAEIEALQTETQEECSKTGLVGGGS